MFLYVLILGILAVVFDAGLEQMGFSRIPVLLGLACGFVADVLMLIHMAHITEQVASSMDEGYANKTTVIQSMIRRVIFIIALFFLGSRPQIDAVAMIIGALGLKAGALLQPIVHRTFFADRQNSQEESITEERRTVYGNDENSDDVTGT
jgi:xanthine/uracil permease